MRKVISLMHMSLDGFTANRKGALDWIQHTPEMFAEVSRAIANVGTAFYGPTTFQMMEQYWPGVLKDPQSDELSLKHARWYAKVDKVVFSKSLKAVEGERARLSHDLPKDVAALKNSGGSDMMIFGSPRLTHSFLRFGLVDEFLMTINPVILGQGIAMFEALDQPVPLTLVSQKTFPTGTALFHYRVNRA